MPILRSFYLLPLVVIGTLSCASTIRFDFPNAAAERCFVPCASYHNTCKTQCLNHRSGRGILALTDSIIGDSICVASCQRSLETCAFGCGGWKRGEKSGQRRVETGENRRHVLRRKLLKADGRWPKLVAACQNLRSIIFKHAQDPRQCPKPDQFEAMCTHVLPKSVPCFDPNLPKTQRSACRTQFTKDDRRAVTDLYSMIHDCLDPPPKARPQPTSRAVPQAQDQEDPH